MQCVEVGARIVAGQEIVQFESDKSVHSLESPVTGIVWELHSPTGSVVAVNDAILTIHAVNDSSDIQEALPKAEQSVAVASAAKSIQDKDPKWDLSVALSTDFEEMWKVWLVNQGLASRTQVENTASLKEAFREMIGQGFHPPFFILVAKEQGQVAGWLGVFPCKNNPLSREKIGEVSLYTQDPFSTSTPSVLLMLAAIEKATALGMTFLLGMTSPSNEPVHKLLNATGFVHLGNAGKQNTQIWTRTL